jgi:dUTP pyrophosphatase
MYFRIFMPVLFVSRLRDQMDDIPLPHYASEGSAGADARAAVDAPVTIAPGAVAMIPTGLAFQIPDGYEVQVRSRSGLAAKHGVFCLNSPGTIDSDYRGEVWVILANFGAQPFVVERGEKIAQLVLARHERIEWREVESLSETARGTGGFGSTGRI